MLEVNRLSKSFDGLKAVREISFKVKKGEIFGLLGPNGAGKTTTVSMIATLLKPDSGSVLYEGKDVYRNLRWWRKKIGVVPQETAFYEELSAEENLLLWAGLYGLDRKRAKKRAWQLLESLGLASRGKDKVAKYSGGMKRRLNLAIGLVHEPEFLLLDEPTVGIDVQTKIYIREFLRELAGSGVSMIYTTHQLEEAEQLCDRIAIMDEGQILAQGTLEELLALLGEKETIIIKGDFSDQNLPSQISDLKDVRTISFTEERLIVEVESENLLPQIMERFLSRGIKVDSVEVKRANLESLFIKLTGKELRD